MGKQHNRRVYAGYYKRYDGKLIYVITLAKDADDAEPIVIFHYVDSAHYAGETEYFTMSKRSFCEMVAINGEYVDKFVRQTQMKVSEWKILDLADDGFRGPKRKPTPEIQNELTERYCRTAHTYEDYAKDICNNYVMDYRKYQLCIKQKLYIGISKSDFAAIVEDHVFIRSCLNTVLKDYKEYFRERYVLGKSIRKYAEDHDMNRGSVEHIQRKFMAAMVAALKQRDEADGKCRLGQSSGEK